MASPDQVAAIIRFALNQLSARSGHHEFEALCREFARRRICSNILPATGPVAAGGDQGRDFETFRTYLSQQSPLLSTFVGLATGRTIVFSCTLQQGDVTGKIRGDIRTITSQGTKVDDVYAFCEANIPIAVRHRLQEEVRGEHGIHLEVFDGTALAEMLADHEIFWIAQRYLHLPSEILPDLPTGTQEAWYREAITKWNQVEQPHPTYGEFEDIKRNLRHATFDPSLTGDLHRWLSLMESFETAETAPQELKRAAAYEIIVASLRGLDTLAGQEQRITAYFQDISELWDSGPLEDAQVLLMYLAGAYARGLLELDPAHLAAWHRELIVRLESLMREDISTTRRCSLFQTLGLLQLVPDITVPSSPVAEERVALVLDTWGEMLDLAPSAPLFPIDRFANLFSMATLVVADHPAYHTFTRRLDTLVAEQAGRAAAAGKCRDRAIRLYKAGRLTDALREFHEARQDWFAGDTIRGALLASVVIAECYDALHLHMAAKYYWLAIGVLALELGHRELHDLTGTGLLAAAQSDYRMGAWFGFLELTEVGMLGHRAFDADPMDYERHTILRATLLSAAVTLMLVRRHCAIAQSVVEESLAAAGILDEAEEVARPDADPWAEMSDDDVARSVEEQLGSFVLADAGPQRTVTWRALGIAWSVTFENTYDVVVAAERFIAISQILLADLAGSDLCLLPTGVSIELSLAADEASADDQPSNDGRRWSIVLRRHESGGNEAIRQTQVEALAAILMVLREVSVLPEEEVDRRVEASFEGGILAKIAPGRVYDDLYATCVSRERFDRSPRQLCSPFSSGEPVAVLEHPDLAWYGGPGPGYSRIRAEELLRSRYQNGTAWTRWTRVSLATSERFMALVAKLRGEGWPDWQILSSVFAIVNSHRVNLGGPPVSREDALARSRRWAGEEQPDWPMVPGTELTEEAMRAARRINMLSTLTVWGLQCRHRSPDLPAIERFLSERFGFMSDDIEHPDPFFAV